MRVRMKSSENKISRAIIHFQLSGDNNRHNSLQLLFITRVCVCLCVCVHALNTILMEQKKTIQFQIQTHVIYTIFILLFILTPLTSLIHYIYIQILICHCDVQRVACTLPSAWHLRCVYLCRSIRSSHSDSNPTQNRLQQQQFVRKYFK